MNGNGEQLIDALHGQFATIVRPDPAAYWSVSKDLFPDASQPRFDGIKELRDGTVVLGFYCRSHIGDVLCTSTLPRKLVEKYGCRVFVVRHRSTHNLFANNPYVSGFRNVGRIHLTECLVGPGHFIQKLERFFCLPIDPYPRPEVYLSHDESKWAWEIRQMLPRNKPVVLVCTRSVTDSNDGSFTTARWQAWVDLLGQQATVVQLALTAVAAYEKAVFLRDDNRRRFHVESVLDNCFVLQNLTPRQFVAVFSVADGYFGTNSGGSHVAAAFDVPSIVVLNSVTNPERLRFPNPYPAQRNPESFLYPQHSFVFP